MCDTQYARMPARVGRPYRTQSVGSVRSFFTYSLCAAVRAVKGEGRRKVMDSSRAAFQYQYWSASWTESGSMTCRNLGREPEGCRIRPGSWSRPGLVLAGDQSIAEPVGFLHGHDRLHWVQGVRGGLPPVERLAGKERGRRTAFRAEPRQHGGAFGCRLAARQVRRAIQRRSEPGAVADDVGRVQALRQCALPGGLPDGVDRPHRVRHGLHQ